MLKSFVEKIVSLAGPKTFELDGKNYSSEPLHFIDTPKYYPSEIMVSSLDSICDLVANEFGSVVDGKRDKVFIHVASEKTVNVFSSYDDRFERCQMYTCEADTPAVTLGRFMDHESAIIQIQSLYIPNDGSRYLLNLLSKTSRESKVTSSDNGVTQTVEAGTGIHLKNNVEIRPRVSLIPFRTFVEVEQPESEFILRVNQEGEIGLFPADGGVWKMEATRNIAKYLSDKLAQMINDGKVVVLR